MNMLRRTKILITLAVCLAFVMAASACGKNEDTNKMDTQMGVSALVALVDSHISSYVSSLEALAMTQEVQSADWESMRGMLTKVEQRNISGVVWFVLPDGSYYTVDLGKTDKNLSDRAYFPRLMAGNKVLGDLVVSKSTGKKSLVVAVPVRRDGEVVGGLGASIFLTNLSEILAEEVDLSPDMTFYAVTTEGKVALHLETELILVENPPLPTNVVLKTSVLTGWRVALGFKD